jgi:beta-N-acetylhexosaminidase
MQFRTILMVATALAASACARQQVDTARALASRYPPAASRSLAALSLREKAAQMVWPTVLGTYTPEDSPEWQRVRTWITEDKVGGFTVSVGSPTEIAAKLDAMQALAETPLLVGADLEFGAGYRARGGYFLPNAIDLGGAVVFPPEMALGAAADTALAYEQGRVTALEGRAIGIHIAYAPILDVNNNPANPVINTRSYGENPALDARLGASFIRGLQEHGMLGTGKHFPGHGDTEVNSHLALPVVNVSRARLDSVELVPFRAAVAAGVGAIMSFHGSMPALDSSGLPATLSPAVLTGLLRGELRFRGLIISDAMDMRGVLDTYGAVDATKRAVAAGADVLIQPLDVRQTIDAIVDGVREGRYPESRIDDAVRRILDAKRTLGLDRDRYARLDSVRSIVGRAEHQALARRAAERSITLVRDSFAQIPIGHLNRGARVLSITVAHRTDLAAGVAFDGVLATRFDAMRRESVDADDPGDSFARLLRAADSADVVIVSSYMGHSWNISAIGAPRAFTRFVGELAVRGRRPIVVALGNPYLLQQIPETPVYLIGWGGFPVSQEAAARALLGDVAISGRLPVAIPPLAPLGAGLDRPVRAVSIAP